MFTSSLFLQGHFLFAPQMRVRILLRTSLIESDEGSINSQHDEKKQRWDEGGLMMINKWAYRQTRTENKGLGCMAFLLYDTIIQYILSVK